MVYRFSLRAGCLLGMFALLLPGIYLKAAWCEVGERVIVLDPGHGGEDLGAKGDGTTEKAAALGFADILRQRLADRYQVHITRADDRWMDLDSRTAMANHLKADLFLSIHASGGFAPRMRGITLHYYQAMPRAELRVANENVQFWDALQDKHIPLSLDLSERLHATFLNQELFPVREIRASPLLVLAGADMPAALIEMGYLNHPAEERLMTDPAALAILGDLIGQGIDAFFRARADGGPDNPNRDLQE